MAFTPHGADLFGEAVQKKHTSKLGDEFLIPPFSVLSAREGWWQERKRAWLDLGIQSELGRGETYVDGEIKQDGLTWGSSPEITSKGLNFYRDKEKKTGGGGAGRDLATPGGFKMPATNYSKSGARGDGRGREITNNN